jgi:tetratricopeptide (TPR) repeat protein
MGRSRRRYRLEIQEQSLATAHGGPPDATPEMLAPTYVTVGAAAWAAESDAPVLALEGLRPWETIRGPVLVLDEVPEAAPRIPDSDDPIQLTLAGSTAAALPAVDEDAAAVAPPEAEAVPTEPDERRPMLVLEPDPPIEVQAELPLVPEPAAAGAAAAAEPPAVEAVEAVEPEPLDPVGVMFEDAQVALADGRTTDARRNFGQVLDVRPSHVGARSALAFLLESAGNQAGALAEYDRGLELDPESAPLLTGRGALLGAMGRYAAAERDLKKVLRVELAHPDALFHLGVVMTRKGLWAEAVPNLRRAVELDPTRGPAYFYLGEALNHVDDLYGAMAAYQRASELMPEHPRALYGLGIVYDRLGRPDDAARMYRRSREVGKR